MSNHPIDINALTEKIIACAFRVHCVLGPGFLEKVYENALRIELELASLDVAQQVPIPVMYRDRLVGDFYADLWVESRVLVELKAVRALGKEHRKRTGFVQFLGPDLPCHPCPAVSLSLLVFLLEYHVVYSAIRRRNLVCARLDRILSADGCVPGRRSDGGRLTFPPFSMRSASITIPGRPSVQTTYGEGGP